MKAWLFTEPGRSMDLVELPDPIPGPGWVVLDVYAAGMCHSDLHILNGPGVVFLDKTPIVLGHEIAGTISAIGSDVLGFSLGERVACGPGPGICGGWAPPSVAHRQRVADHPACGRHAPGLVDNGGYAEKCLVHASKLVSIPDGLSFAAAAVATDAILTAYHAVRTAGQVRLGEVVGIVGMGGLGMNGLRTAVLAGARVYGVDLNESIFDEARQAGAIGCFTSVSALSELRPDLIVDFAGSGNSTALALETVRIGGRVVLVGLGSPEATINTYSFVTAQVDLQASLGGNMDELAQVYALLVSGGLTPHVEEVPFKNIHEGFERLEKGSARGRLFTNPNA